MTVTVGCVVVTTVLVFVVWIVVEVVGTGLTEEVPDLVTQITVDFAAAAVIAEARTTLERSFMLEGVGDE